MIPLFSLNLIHKLIINVPLTYKQQLHIQWSTLRQGNRPVVDYIQEWEKLAVMCDIPEPEEIKIGRFIGGLREDLREKLEVMPNLTLDLACNSAITYKKYARRRNTYTQPSRPAPYKPSSSNNMGNSLGKVVQALT